ncbi:MAG: YbjN domain-containing protein [Bacteroidales bacterium]|nr:YbjN domain-containing protein [Bacteroidales bacterium]
MNFITNLINKCGGRLSTVNPPEVKFGRFAESDETDEMVLLRNCSSELYKEGNCKEAYIYFFEYMRKQGGPAVTITIYEDKQIFTFELIQGSKIVRGAITDSEVFTWADVAEYTELNVALMRYLLTKNSEFAYCKFAIENNIISLRQRCPIQDMSPAAFNEMLSEIAISADSVDDVLVEEFPSLKAIDIDNIIELPQQEVDIKIKYLKNWILETENLLKTTEKDSTKTYIILRLLFKILYLISPEGTLLNDIRRIYAVYATEYKPQESNAPEINFKMLTMIRKIYAMTDEEIKKSIYKVHAVFPEISYMTFQEMSTSIVQHISLIDICLDANRDDLVIVMCEYIVGLNNVHHGMPAIAQDLLLVFWKVLNPEYFKGIGFVNEFYNFSNQKLNAIKISDSIGNIVKKYSKEYPELIFNTANLDFGSMSDFSYTFLREFSTLNIPN